MFYRGPGFPAVLRFCSSPTHSAPLSRQVVSLPQSSCVSSVELSDREMVGEGVGEGVGMEPNNTMARKPGPL
jgi:hypothetical protein